MSEEVETRKVTLDDGTIKYEALDGKQYASRSGAWKRNQKLRDQGLLDESESVQEPSTEGVGESETEESGGDWTSFDWGDEIPDSFEFIPGPLKQLQKPIDRKKRSKEEIAAEIGTNVAILKIGYKSADHLMTRYKRAVTADPDALVTHQEADYEWISTITNTALDHRGLSIARFLGPGSIALLANSYWFGAPLYKISKQAKRNPFKSGMIRRILSKIPILGRRFRKKTILHHPVGDHNVDAQ
jgi:hypothetical protein